MDTATNERLLAIDIGQSGSRYSIAGERFSISRGMFAGEPIEVALEEIISTLNQILGAAINASI